MNKIGIVFALMLVVTASGAQPVYLEHWRPQYHFSPKAHWMNDPNGMVFFRGTYHLFFQYYPDSSVWGPMHWGHATSADLVHWEEQPIALYPDKLGYIFSGSAIVDNNNTSGFAPKGDTPLVAIYTQHDPVGAAQNRNDFQNQSIAYSLDNGKTWVKYDHNPVLKNPGIADFRDPKVFWESRGSHWVMVLAVTDHVEYYTSPNLKEWKKAGEFGKDAGAHGGVWECPDLFPMHDADGRTVWVLIVNINPGGPNGGSATQYFLGDFDGKTFTPTTAGTRWLDYGPDEYAGVTWSNTGNERIFLGWMSNWLYGQRVPTDPWRSANTLPRSLGLEKVGDSLYLTSSPWYHLDILHRRGGTKVNFPAALPKLAMIFLQSNKVASLDLVFSNDEGDSVTIGYNDADHCYSIDRRHAGVPLGPDFDRIYSAPRLAQDRSISLVLYIDACSFELSADDGMTVMTALAFPHHPYTKVALRKPADVELKYSWVVSMDGIHN